jgi:hypothetical protein
MIGPAEIDRILAVYAKHGWILRRVLLTARLKEVLGDGARGLFQNADLVDSDIDAAWFSRPRVDGGVPWEIRHLSETPYALLENADEFSPGFEGALAAVEERLRGAASKRRPA